MYLFHVLRLTCGYASAFFPGRSNNNIIDLRDPLFCVATDTKVDWLCKNGPIDGFGNCKWQDIHIIINLSVMLLLFLTMIWLEWVVLIMLE